MSIFSKVNEKETSARAIEEDVALSGTIIERLLSPDLCTFQRFDSCVNAARVGTLRGGACKLLIIQGNMCVEFYAQVCKKRSLWA